MKRCAAMLVILMFISVPEISHSSEVTHFPGITLGDITEDFPGGTSIFVFIQGESQDNVTVGACSVASLGFPGVFLPFPEERIENDAYIFSYNHQINIPTDPNSGQPTGTRVHQPITFTKFADLSSPKLFTALITGERLKKVEFRYYKKAPDSSQQCFALIELSDAVITDMRMFTIGDGKLYEEVSLTFRKIMATHPISFTYGEDDWRVPKGR